MVTLLKNSVPVASQTTGADGSYDFNFSKLNLPAGLYTVETPVLSQIFQSGKSTVGGFVDSNGTYYPYPGTGSAICLPD